MMIVPSRKANLSMDLRKAPPVKHLRITKIRWLVDEFWRTLKIIANVTQISSVATSTQTTKPTSPKKCPFFHDCISSATAQSYNATTNGHNSSAINSCHISLLKLPTHASVGPVPMIVIKFLGFPVQERHRRKNLAEATKIWGVWWYIFMSGKGWETWDCLAWRRPAWECIFSMLSKS